MSKLYKKNTKTKQDDATNNPPFVLLIMIVYLKIFFTVIILLNCEGCVLKGKVSYHFCHNHYDDEALLLEDTINNTIQYGKEKWYSRFMFTLRVILMNDSVNTLLGIGIACRSTLVRLSAPPGFSPPPARPCGSPEPHPSFLSVRSRQLICEVLVPRRAMADWT